MALKLALLPTQMHGCAKWSYLCLISSAQGRGGDELAAEYAKSLECSMYAGLTGRGTAQTAVSRYCAKRHHFNCIHACSLMQGAAWISEHSVSQVAKFAGYCM